MEESIIRVPKRRPHNPSVIPRVVLDIEKVRKKFAERLYYGFHGRDWARKDGETGMLRSEFYLDRLCG